VVITVRNFLNDKVDLSPVTCKLNSIGKKVNNDLFDLTAEQDEFLAIIDKSSENLLSIINNILDLSKIESNKIEIENIVFDAAEEFESAIETYSVSAAEKNIDLNFYMDPTISNKLKGDPTKIKEIIINLLYCQV